MPHCSNSNLPSITSMTGTNISAYLAAVKWDDDDMYLQDFVQKHTLPQVAKITKGTFMNLGVPSLSNPSLNQTVLLTQSGKRIKVAAQCVKFKDNNRVVPVGTKLSIPDNYDGWFEILSEDGRAVRCIESVAELLKKFPETCLVRENIKAHLAKTDDSEVISEKTRTVSSGETLILLSEVHANLSKSKSYGRYLRCFTTKGETIFLNVEQKGKFSPVAGEENISGVHTIKNLLTKRFPLMVRLVHGKPPSGIKTNSHFVTEMRLYSLFEEESIMAIPLLKDSQVIALPPSAPMKVQAPRNSESLIKLKIYDSLVEKCKSIVQDVSDKIQVFDISLSKELRAEKFQPKQRIKNLSPMHRIQRSVSDPNSKYKENSKPELNGDPHPHENNKTNGTDNYDEIDQIYDYVRGFAPLPHKISQVEVICNGHHPMSNSASPASTPTTSDSADTSDTPDDRPIPPPVETIPVRRLSKDDSPAFEASTKALSKLQDTSSKEDLVEGHIYEMVDKKDPPKLASEVPAKVNGPGEKLFIPHHINHGVKKLLLKGPAQNRIQHKSKFKHSKSSPALKESIAQKSNQRAKNSRSKSLTTSPLFNIRYKSLINLAIDFDTLDSSNSGDKTSFGSGGSKDQRYDRKNKLQRPKSLIDIFGEVNQIESMCQPRYLNAITNGIENRKLIFTHESVNGKLLNGHHKRIGTLYL